MSNLTPELPTRQLLQVQQEVEAAEQKLHNLQASVTAAQDDWDDQKSQIASDTKVTIDASKKAIAEAVKDARLELQDLEQVIIDAQVAHQDMLKLHGKETADLKQAVAELERDNKVLAHTNATLREDNQSLTSEIVVRQESVKDLKDTEQDLSVAVASLQAQHEKLEDQLSTLDATIVKRTDDLQVLDDTFTKDKLKFGADIRILELKKEALEREIMENQARDEQVRENLARWKKTLDEKDANLRIREAQVNQQQKAIARNYNLLNL